MRELGFYEKYIALLGNLKDQPDRATPYKIDYLQKIIKNGKVYKYISFEGEENLVKAKIETLKQGNIWFSFYKTLNDETEFQINYNSKEISQKTGRSISNVHLLINYFTEMYDVYSLSYEYQDYMWRDYASDGNGICIEFDVGNYDYLFPIEYLEKVDIDFNKMIITAINDGNPTLGIMPWVIKNPYNITCKMDSTKEKEVRMLYSPYDLGEVNSGKIELNVKERLEYKGIAKSYSDFALKVSKVIFGEKCNDKLADELKAYLTINGIEYKCL